ncbi:MAG: hypothetical protein ACI4IW_03555 [Oscillospiraceae bacterium]
MKKALALVLALVLALSLGVSAFALDGIVVLNPAPSGSSDPIRVDLISFEENPTVVLYAGDFENYPDPDVYYFAVGPHDAEAVLEDVAVTANGAVSAKVFDYDPAKYVVYGADDQPLTYHVSRMEGGKEVEVLLAGLFYEDAVKYAKEYKDENRNINYGVFCDEEVVIVELTVPVNTSASYKEGSVKITGVEVVGKKKTNVSATIKFVIDVTIFDYEEVKYCATEDEVLYVGVEGYSDYLTALYGYKTPDLQDKEIRQEAAMVVSTTAFRAIQGKDLTVSAGDVLSATIKSVAAGQKGVNFLPFADLHVDAAGNVIGIQFGFVGDQTIASDFVVTVAPELSYFELRELFGKKVEEEDVITYYVLKDGKVYDSFTVDYMTVDYNEVVELEINGKAGDTLGMYEIVLEVPADPAEGEENPNTGAESVIGVVAAMAVVSVAAAAAVSLKK